MQIERFARPAVHEAKKSRDKSARDGGFSDIETGCRRRGP